MYRTYLKWLEWIIYEIILYTLKTKHKLCLRQRFKKKQSVGLTFPIHEIIEFRTSVRTFVNVNKTKIYLHLQFQLFQIHFGPPSLALCAYQTQRKSPIV